MLALYSVTLGLGALLLFWVQPMFSKMVLPLLGGSPAVWNIAVVFFQAALLAGYLYAHLGNRWLRPKWQATTHLILLALAFAALPISIAAGLRPPSNGEPAVWLLSLLTLSVGLPFVALAATAPMLQGWFAHTGHRDAVNPYILYAVSNFGSILALLAYPVLFEPVLTLGQQSLAWALGFALLALLIGACAWLLLRDYQAHGSDQRSLEEIGLSHQVDWPRRLYWLVLAFVPSSLLLGVTQYISTDIASAPLLWVIPLILYLGTFVIVFARRPLIPHRVALFLHVPMVMVMALLFYWPIIALHVILPLHLTVFLVTALVCHGELAKRRPAPSRLTEFYLWMSLGGVLGGAFTALLAPNIFDTVVEYPLALVAACFLRPRQDPGPMTALKALPLAILVILLVAPRLAGYDPGDFSLIWLLPYMIPMALLAYGCRRRPLLFGLAIAAFLLAGAYDDRSDEIATSRGYFGVSRVLARGSGDDRVLVFRHGTTKHGVEYVDPARRRIPLAYYHREGPLGQAFKAMDGRLRQVAGVGLGIGTVACYQSPGRQWTFYEIDPLVVSLAQDQRYFHFLSDCAPEARIVVGDGRLSLSSEVAGKDAGAAAPAFDLLILDAFSSDSIPLHLVTREAMAVYLARLASGGLMMFHISNRYIDLRPVLADLAADAGIFAYVQRNHPEDRDKYHYGSSWVAMARSEGDLAPLLTAAPKDSPWRSLEARPGRRVWTDDYGNLITITRAWRQFRGEQSED